jgi:calcium-dependent protein kinase
MTTPEAKAATARRPSADKKWVIGQTEKIDKYYKLGKRLGEPGQFGYAVAATHLKTKSERAVKVISKARFTRSADRQYHYEQLRAEIEVMKKLEHANVIKMFEVFETETELYIVMELCSGGELFDRIKSQGNYSEKDAAKVLRQMFEGIRYMHSKGVAHCDLKPDNFLFLSKAKDAPLKIIDFGMSKFVKRREYFQVICGTPYYVAPEVIEGKYSEHCDLWSLGVVMFVMLFGYPPFYADQEKHGDLTDEMIFKLVRKGFAVETKDGYGAHFPKAIPVSDSAKDLIGKLLNLDTAKRITATEALEHPWLTGEKASPHPLVGNVLTNLTSFTGTCKFKTAVLSLMTDYLGPDELSSLKKSFKEIDENGDGTITLAELKKAFAKGNNDLKINESELEKLLKMADIDGDGALSYDELVKTSVHRKLVAKEERLWEAFCKLDLNGDGRVSADEIAKVLGDATKAKELIAEVDVNGDGTVDYDEFIKIWVKREGDLTPALNAAPAKKA